MRRRARDLRAAKADAAGRGRQLADHRLEQGRLAHAVVAQDAHELAVHDLETDPEDDRYLLIAGGEVAHFEHLFPPYAKRGEDSPPVIKGHFVWRGLV